MSTLPTHPLHVHDEVEFETFISPADFSHTAAPPSEEEDARARLAEAGEIPLPVHTEEAEDGAEETSAFTHKESTGTRRTVQAKDALEHYLEQIREYKPLSFEEEQALAKAWQEHHDKGAADKLMTSHLKLVVKVALGFKGYGLPMAEIIQEGNVGLMQAIQRFDPAKGFRLSTYAMWWIRATIQEYVLASWSLVKIGTTAAQKKLFFNFRKLRARLMEDGLQASDPALLASIAAELDVKAEDVQHMSQRMQSGDQSLNVIMAEDGTTEWIDWLADDAPTQEETMISTESTLHRHKALNAALAGLTPRERDIFIARRLMDERRAPTLDVFSHKYGISRERVRQLEEKAFEHVRQHLISSLAGAA